MVFLSASIPDPNNQRYYDPADVIAIRDAVRALATVVIPKTQLIWGGHPAITPLIRYVITNVIQANIKAHVTLYQSNFFREVFPVDNDIFIENTKFTKKKNTEESSLNEMRMKMLTENQFLAGVFIGGMEGVEKEYQLFRDYQPKAELFPIASTGGAAKIIYNSINPKLDTRLTNDFAYMALFRRLFSNIIN